MNRGRDPFDILAGHDPVDPDDSPSADSAEGRAMFDRIISDATSPSEGDARVRRVGPRWALALAAVVVLATVALTFAFNLRATETSVGCYAQPSLEGGFILVASGDSPDPDVCVEPWSDGTLSLPGLTPGEVPPLTACVNSAGAIVVFPTDDPGICSDLGLAGASPSQPEERFARISAAIDAIDASIAEVECLPLEEAADAARHILDEQGLASWSVEIAPGSPDRPCASLAVDTPSETVLIVPASNPEPEPEP